MSTEQKSYEAGWGRCAACGCRRPQSALKPPDTGVLERGRERYKAEVTGVCGDVAWCTAQQSPAVPDKRMYLCSECGNPVASLRAGANPKTVHEECKAQRYKVTRELAAERREKAARRG